VHYRGKDQSTEPKTQYFVDRFPII